MVEAAHTDSHSETGAYAVFRQDHGISLIQHYEIPFPYYQPVLHLLHL